MTDEEIDIGSVFRRVALFSSISFIFQKYLLCDRREKVNALKIEGLRFAYLSSIHALRDFKNTSLIMQMYALRIL